MHKLNRNNAWGFGVDLPTLCRFVACVDVLYRSWEAYNADKPPPMIPIIPGKKFPKSTP